MFLLLFGIESILVVGLGLMTLSLFRNQEELSKRRDRHFHSWQLADELRQSSDDLTRMARTYVATGNAEYEHQYREVLEIRNGLRTHPANYNSIYWYINADEGKDTVLHEKTLSMRDLLLNEEFRNEEFEKLDEALKNSDQLVSVERIAINAVKGLYDDGNGNFTVKGKPDREFATRTLNDEAFHHAKANIMKPIREFFILYNRRVEGDIVAIEHQSTNLLFGVAVMIILVIGTFFLSLTLILRQINKREQAEEILQENEKRFRDIVTSSSDWIWEIDQHWKYSYSSANIEQILGYTVDEVIGRSPFDFMTEASRKHAAPYFESIVNTRGIIKDFENWNLHKDGHQVCLLTNACPVIDKEGRLTGFRGADKDISQRMQKEIELQQSEEKYRYLVENIMDGVYRSTHEGKFVDVNQAMVNILGYESKEELMSIDIKSQLYFSIEDRESADLEEILEEMAIFRLRKKDGSEIWVEDHGRHVKDEHGNILFHEGTLRDVTERIHQENQIRKLNETLEERVAERTLQLETTNRELAFHLKEIEQFTYIATHDLQEPLLTLTNFTNLIREEYDGKLDENGNKYIEFIYNSATRMRNLVKDLLEYSLLGKESEKSAADCNTIVAEVLSDMDNAIQSSQAIISVDELPVVQGFATELRMLFQNLINNAVKFRRKEIAPQIIITAKKLKKEWLFTIDDNGIGIDDKDKEKIFVIFKRMQNRKDYEGTGIGLAHCKKIVELHGGRIWAESNKDGGSSFRFTIPFKE